MRMGETVDRLSPAEWESFRQQMGYSEQELAQFRADPRRAYVTQHADRLNAWVIVAEVMASHGCAAGHQVGQRFSFSPNGLYLSAQGPGTPCLQILVAVAPAVAVMQERIISGLSPEPYLFNHVGCVDVGLACGGWGHVALVLYAEPAQ
jgi:uncharacterized repeat protein (TIGR04076 family)